MTEIGITTLMIIIANIFCSVTGLNDRYFFERYNFNVEKILQDKNNERLLTSGFFHVNWLHLILNVVTLCCFSSGIELKLGAAKYLLIYFAGLLGGNLFALLVNRRHNGYCAAGASGGVTAVIFATIAVIPGYQVVFFGVHLPIPGWFYGFLYVLFSIYGITSKRDNIGHEVQLAGGLAGLLLAILLVPVNLPYNYLAILCVVIPSVFFIFIIINMPRFILIDNYFYNQSRMKFKIKQIQYAPGADHQKEIDLILEKIHQQGIQSLSDTEKIKLDYYSKKI